MRKTPKNGQLFYGAGGGIRTHEGLRHRISPAAGILSQAPVPCWEWSCLFDLNPARKPLQRVSGTPAKKKHSESRFLIVSTDGRFLPSPCLLDSFSPGPEVQSPQIH